MHRQAIIAGRGTLPLTLARAAPGALYVTFGGVEIAGLPEGLAHAEERLEKLGALFETLRGAGVEEVVFAGALNRADLDPSGFDAKTMALLPRLMGAMQKGDDGLLREIIAIFAEEGFATIAAHDIAPGLVLKAGSRFGRAPSPAEDADIARGREILATLSPLDIGQGVVVESGLCLGVETLQGTDALLGFVADTQAHLRRGKGVLVKDAKLGQDLRIDMPTIGAATLRAAARAGLAGIAIGAGRVIVLDEDIEALAGELGLFVVAI